MEQNNNQCNGQNDSPGIWWKEYNLRPVRILFIRYAREIWGALVGVLYFFLCLGIMTLIGVCLGHILYEKGLENIFVILCFGIMIIGEIIIIYKSIFENNKIRKKRGELLDSDYIEISNSFFSKRYLLCARGTGNSHKFGVFDTLKINLCIPMIYDKLEWIKTEPTIGQKGLLLKGVLNGQPIFFDLAGNKYE